LRGPELIAQAECIATQTWSHAIIQLLIFDLCDTMSRGRNLDFLHQVST